MEFRAIKLNPKNVQSINNTFHKREKNEQWLRTVHWRLIVDQYQTGTLIEKK